MNTRVVIPCRITFANIWEPKSVNGSEPKYSVSCIVPKKDIRTMTMVVDRNVQPSIERMECASGDFCNVSVNFYAFNFGVQKGIAAGLGNIQKVKTGERFGGRVSASADFGVLEEEPFEVPEYMQ